MIRIESVSKSFGRLAVLNGIDLDVRPGACLALIGPNACGKTTLIKTVLGMVIPSAGRVGFDGRDIRHDVEYRRHIGYMPQIGRYPEHMTVGDVFEMIREIRKEEAVTDEELVEAYGLRDMFGKPMRTLSGGTTQKVSAALAFLFRPKVMILDEPTAGLDPVAAETLKDKIIREHRDGRTFIITSHLLAELDELITDIVFMQEGRIRLDLPKQELVTRSGQPSLAKAIIQLLKETDG